MSLEVHGIKLFDNLAGRSNEILIYREILSKNTSGAWCVSTDLPTDQLDGEPGGPFEVDVKNPVIASVEGERQEFESPEEENKYLHNKQFKQDIRERKRYAVAAFRLSSVWVCFLIIATMFQLVLSIWGKGLTEGMFIALATATTTSVLGVWALVGNYLFGGPGRRLNKVPDKED
ncbi:MAG: hypothetical protein AAFX08_09655 [Pseudomonadota bacterium]